MNVRSFAGQSDLEMMKAILRDYRREVAYSWHMGDLVIMLNTSLRAFMPTEAVYIWSDNEVIIGFSVLLPHVPALSFFVRPHLVGTSDERDILRWSMSRLRELPDKPDAINIYNVPESDLARVALLKSEGFVLWEHHGLLMTRDLSESLDAVDAPKGFTLEWVQDERDIARWVECALGVSPRGYFKVAEYIALSKTPEYRAILDSVIKNVDGEIVTFSQGWCDPIERSGLIEPVATHPDYQRMGLATATVLRTFYELRECGAEKVELHTRVLNTIAGGLYQRVGMKVSEYLFNYRKVTSI